MLSKVFSLLQHLHKCGYISASLGLRSATADSLSSCPYNFNCPPYRFQLPFLFLLIKETKAILFFKQFCIHDPSE